MKLVTRYILRRTIDPFLFGVAAFTSLFIGGGLIFDLADLVSRWQVPLDIALQYFFLSLPQIVVYTFPMATLLAALLTFNRLSGNGEITAMKAGGISFYRMVAPVIFLALAVSLLTILINETIVPYAARAVEDIKHEARHGTTRVPGTQRHLRIFDSDGDRPNYLLYARRFDGEEETMYGVYVQEYEQGRLSRLVEAEKAEWTETGWNFRDGTIYYLSGRERLPRMGFAEYVLNLGREPEDIRRLELEPEEMSFRELREHIEVRSREGEELDALLVELHHKLAIPFASLIFALIGPPLGLQPARGGSSIGLGLSILIIFIYYTLMTVSTVLAQGGAVHPVLGAWLQNIVFAAVGLWFIIRAGR